jgi:hypothetical protein
MLGGSSRQETRPFTPDIVRNPKSGLQLHIRRFKDEVEVLDPRSSAHLLATLPANTSKSSIIHMMQDPNSALYRQGVTSRGLGTPSRAEVGFINQGWVGCEKTHRQLICGTIGKNGLVQVRNDAGIVLATYSQGTTRQQIADTMANPLSVLYMQGSYFAPKFSTQYIIDKLSIQGKYKDGDTIGDLPGGHTLTYRETLPGQGPAGGARNVKTRTDTYVVPDAIGPGKDDVRAWVIRAINNVYIKFPDVKLASPSSADSLIINQGWVGCLKTHKQLIMRWDGNKGLVLVMDDAGTVLGTYAQGTTKEQIADTMANPNSPLYMKGSELRIATTNRPNLAASVTVDSANTIAAAPAPKATEWHLAISPQTGLIQVQQVREGVTTVMAELNKGTTMAQAQELLKTLSLDRPGLQATKPQTSAIDQALAMPRLQIG